jgi:hypothetical protein
VLNIPTKINKGTVEIITPVELIKKGDKVGSSESALLAKLGIRPFSYGLQVINVYEDGSVFSPEVLDLTEDDLVEKFATGVSMVASLSLALSYPTLAAAPHMFINGYKNVLAVAVETDYSYPHADEIKEYLKVILLLLYPSCAKNTSKQISYICFHYWFRITGKLLCSDVISPRIAPLVQQIEYYREFLQAGVLAGPNLVMVLVCRTRASSPLLPLLPLRTLVWRLLPRKKRRRPSPLRSQTRRWASACSTTKLLATPVLLQVFGFCL